MCVCVWGGEGGSSVCVVRGRVKCVCVGGGEGGE